MQKLCALAIVLASVLAAAQEQRLTSPAWAPQETKPTGQEDFDRVCKVCHGAEARGDTGPRLVPFSREYQELLAIVREGVGQMPPIAERQLTDEGVARVLEYLKSLSR
jgi:mono/diheme cytochrome c family protein